MKYRLINFINLHYICAKLLIKPKTIQKKITGLTNLSGIKPATFESV